MSKTLYFTIIGLTAVVFIFSIFLLIIGMLDLLSFCLGVAFGVGIAPVSFVFLDIKKRR